MKRIHLWLNEEDLQRLEISKKLSQKSKSAIVRSLISSTPIREMPPLEYHEILNQLRKIGTNMNQIATVANSTKIIDKAFYKQTADELAKVTLGIMEAVELR